MERGRQFQEPLPYDEHLPDPGEKPGRVEFAGRQFPATSFHKGDYSHSFTVPMENGAVAGVSYFPHQQLANVHMMHLQEVPASRMHSPVIARLVGVVDEHGHEADDAVSTVRAAHGERNPDMPRSPEEAASDLEYYSKLSIPAHVQKDNQRLLPKLRESWGWKT